MSKAAWSGPLITFGQRQNPAAGGSNNPDQGPNAFLGGSGLIDPRVNYNVTKKGWVGIGTGMYRCLAQAPAALGTAKIAALAHVVSGVAMTLAVASTGITVLASGLLVPGSYNTVPTGALVLDANPALVNYGLADTNGNYNNNVYDNTKAIARAVSITAAASAVGGHFIVAGYDIYGYPMTENINAAAGAATTNGKKAFKFITSVTPQFTDAHNYSVGTLDIFGLPLAAAFFHEALVWWNSTLITASTGFVAADATSPATATTGDVRGTYAVQDAADGTKRLSVAVGPGQSTLGGSSIFGVTQV